MAETETSETGDRFTGGIGEGRDVETQGNSVVYKYNDNGIKPK